MIPPWHTVHSRSKRKVKKKGGNCTPVLHLEGHVWCTENSEYCLCFCKVHAGELYRLTHPVWFQFSEHCPRAAENLLLRRVTKLTSLEVFHSSPPPPPTHTHTPFFFSLILSSLCFWCKVCCPYVSTLMYSLVWQLGLSQQSLFSAFAFDQT